LSVERSAPHGAVFLSYASQDVDAVRRISDALRAAGIEVWFDQSELSGGDAWDAKIRRQIRECTLFLPIISANTQARPEGYFRVEWKLADRRTESIGKSKAFLVPICIDDTSDTKADVPDSFLDVQWVRLPQGEAGASFSEQVRTLLVRGALNPLNKPGPALPAAASAEHGLAAEHAPASFADSSLPTPTPRRRWIAPNAAVLIALLAAAVWQLWRNAAPIPTTPPRNVPSAPKSSEKLAHLRPRLNPDTAGKEDAATPVAPSVSEQNSIAVLAFKTIGEDRDSEIFSEGVSEELLNALAKVTGLRVAARASAFFFKDKNATTQEMGQKLNVTYLVDGSVQRVGSTVRVNARLSRADTSEQVWSEKFDEELKNILALQDAVAGRIAENLKLKLGYAPRVTKPVIPEAYTLLLEGRHFWNLRTTEGFDRAEAAFLKAIAIDPQFAQAHAALADVWTIRSTYALQDGKIDHADPRLIAQARAEAQRAIELEPNLPDAYPPLAYCFFLEMRFAEAEQQFQKAIALNPNSTTAHAWRATLLQSQGRLDLAMREYETSSALDPLWAVNLTTQVEALNFSKRFEEALHLSDRAMALRPDYVPNLGNRARTLFALGRHAEAVAAARQVRSLLDRDPRRDADISGIWVLIQMGLMEEASSYAHEAFATLPEQSHQRGFILGALGRFDAALPYLERTPAVIRRRLYWDTMWDAWRDDPRFTQLMEKLDCVAEYKTARETLSRMIQENEAPK
jgi:TolB-like protein/Tfp pilus assembly protein PilF